MIASLPNHLLKLPHISVLDISTNQISTLPEFLSGLVSLTDLRASDNNMHRLPHSLVLPGLTSLSICRNYLDDALPPLLCQSFQSSLRILRLSNNGLSHISAPATVVLLTALVELNIGINSVGGETQPSLPRVHLGEILQEAYQLDTPPPPSNSAPLVNQSGESDNPKSGITPSDGGDILTPPLSSPHLEQDEKTTTPNERHLSSIVKTQAQLVSGAKRELTFGNRTQLRLNELNQIAKCGHSSVRDMFKQRVSLTYLDINSNNFEELPAEISSCRFLRTLIAHRNRLRDLPDMTQCIYLQHLQLSFNKLKFIPLDRIYTGSLRRVDVRSNKILQAPTRDQMKNIDDECVILWNDESVAAAGEIESPRAAAPAQVEDTNAADEADISCSNAS